MIASRFSNLTRREKVTFSLHFTYSLIEGVIAGVIALNEFVFVKSLLGSELQVSLLFQFSVVPFLLLIVFNEYLKRVKNMRKLLKYTAIITRLPLILLFFFPRNPEQLTGTSIYHAVFLGIFLFYFLANPIVFPTINLFLKSSYRHLNFGRLYSYAATGNKVVMIVTTFVYGWMLDNDPFVFVFVFPFIAGLGILSLLVLSRIPYHEVITVRPRNSLLGGMKDSILEMKRILVENVPFRHFQIGFMLYGFGFMSSAMIIVLYFNDELGLNYTSVAFYRNASNILAIVSLPFFGTLIGKIDPRRFSGYSFLSMALFIFSLVMTKFIDLKVEFWEITLYLTLAFYIIFHGIFAATMSLTWSIGSAYFCKPHEAGIYQSIHMVLTALRAIIAPIMGFAFYKWLGFYPTFVIAIGFLLMGVAVMVWSERRVRL